ncbi:hypothetical protein HMI55_007262 [Coelomomyces lativittatus]|nr:hypothetical protein HMI55_007262 [Coelomomyces lativittatus]
MSFIASYYFQLKLKANKKERASPTHLISTTTSYSNNLETTNPTNSIDSGLAHKLFQLKKQILIIYGSQTGTGISI